jgi:hypothetical protein
MKITNKLKNEVHILKEVRNLNNTDIAHSLGISRNSVIKILKEESTVDEQTFTELKKLEQDNDKQLFKMMISDNRLATIFNTVLTKLTMPQNIDDEIERFGLKSLTNIYGVLADKHLASKRLMIEERALQVKERTLELKEQELQARLDNPDAFATVTIINDADEVVKYTKEYNDLIRHESNTN